MPRCALAVFLAAAGALAGLTAGCGLRCASPGTVSINFSGGGMLSPYTATLVMAGRHLSLECPQTATVEGWPVSCRPDGITVRAVGVDIHRVTEVTLTLTTNSGNVLFQDAGISLPAPTHPRPDDETCERAAVVMLPVGSIEAVLKVTPAANDFGAVPVGTTSAPFRFTVMNVSGRTLGAPPLSATGDFVVTDHCATAIPPGGHCTFGVIFHPTIAGARTGTLTIGTPAGPEAASLAGLGIVLDAGGD